MRGVIFGLTQQDANTKLDKLIEHYTLYNTAQIQQRNESQVYFDNKDAWKAIGINCKSKTRGLRCNIAYIDARIDQDTINTFIRPCLCESPYCGIFYFYDFMDRE